MKQAFGTSRVMLRCWFKDELFSGNEFIIPGIFGGNMWKLLIILMI